LKNFICQITPTRIFGVDSPATAISCSIFTSKGDWNSKRSTENDMASSTCANCGCQIHTEGNVWVDNSGGDVCGMFGDNDPHVDILEVEIPLHDGDDEPC